MNNKTLGMVALLAIIALLAFMAGPGKAKAIGSPCSNSGDLFIITPVDLQSCIITDNQGGQHVVQPKNFASLYNRGATMFNYCYRNEYSADIWMDNAFVGTIHSDGYSATSVAALQGNGVTLHWGSFAQPFGNGWIEGNCQNPASAAGIYWDQSTITVDSGSTTTTTTGGGGGYGGSTSTTTTVPGQTTTTTQGDVFSGIGNIDPTIALGAVLFLGLIYLLFKGGGFK